MAGEQMLLQWDEDGSRADPPAPPLRALPLADPLRRLARRRVYLGCSSWKYPGWLGQVYDPRRYEVQGRFAEKKFNAECLAEYARIFPTVGGDFSFYQFPTAAAWERIFSQLPDGFRFGLKVPEDITVQRFPNLPRYGARRGAANEHFMDPQLLKGELLSILEPYRAKIGVIIFEFGTLRSGPLRDPAQFAGRLDGLLSELPTGRFDFAVEVRNRAFLNGGGGSYLACLRDHGVAHCFNSWTHMPAVVEQLQVNGAFTAGHAVGRFLLKPGRTYEEAVRQFAPYEHIQEPYPEGRDGLAGLIEHCAAEGRTLYAFVNNRFEGNAIETIAEVIAGMDLDL